MPLAEILWRITPWAERRFLGLIDEIADLDPDSEEAYILRDEIRRLPNFPHRATTTTVIRREVISN